MSENEGGAQKGKQANDENSNTAQVNETTTRKEGAAVVVLTISLWVGVVEVVVGLRVIR